MKLRNKRTGEIIDVFPHKHSLLTQFNSLAELNEEWEDVPEEPKEWWYIDIHGPHKVTNNDEYYQQVKVASKEIGNYFESKEEAEKAVEKLKAFKRLKDKGFRFEYYDYSDMDLHNHIQIKAITNREVEDSMLYKEDLDLLFGGEE